MRKLIVCLCLMLSPVLLVAEAPTVPRTINFAGMTLKLNERARKKIQTEVNALTKYPKYFQIKVDRLHMYFPIIERIFNEEGLPEDFKYLVLQESALISDAVSTSNAVGFWQFKKAAATEVGLRIDRFVDERKNIVSSTRGAARYLKKNNNLYFDNWVHALLAYHQGPGGAMKLVGDKYRGARSMTISSSTHWYVIKFLAHKVAFEQVAMAPPKLYLSEFYEGSNKTIKQIAQDNRLSFDLVNDYNKWLARGKVPNDKPYAVILPFEKVPANLMASNSGARKTTNRSNTRQQAVSTRTKTAAKSYRTYPEKYPQVVAMGSGKGSKLAKVNNIPGIIVGAGDSFEDLSKLSGVTVQRIKYYNDLKGNAGLKAGQALYLKPKKNKALTHYHVAEPGENLWSISQKYGVKLSKLRAKNRMNKRQNEVKPGRVLWLRFIRPEEEPIAYQSLEPSEPKEARQTKTLASKTKTNPSRAIAESSAETKSKPEPKSGPKSESSHYQPGTTVDTVVKKDPPEPKTSSETQKSIAEATVQDLPEEEEYTLDEPVNFVGVDKGANITKTGQKVHVVQQGETLYGISKQYDLTVDELVALNKLEAGASLSIGQELITSRNKQTDNLNSNNSENTGNQYVVYTVKPGETLYSIARDHEATIKDIMDWNQKSDFNIAVGEELKLKKLP